MDKQRNKERNRSALRPCETKFWLISWLELQIMESKLEAMRTRAEEASSGAVGDAHAKLLRQIETLQTQYAVASENWQGIETSLMARAANLEKERDEASRRESDIRRKAREAVSQRRPSYPSMITFERPAISCNSTHAACMGHLLRPGCGQHGLHTNHL